MLFENTKAIIAWLNIWVIFDMNSLIIHSWIDTNNSCHLYILMEFPLLALIKNSPQSVGQVLK